MKAPSEQIKVRSSYNLAAISFTPEEIANSIKQHIHDFKIEYEPDFRQKIADSWPCSIDDTSARTDWNWQHQYDLGAITKEMLLKLGQTELI